jgi:hypothetical protein
VDGGTRVEVRLNYPSRERGGLLSAGPYSKLSLPLGRLVAALAPNLAVALLVRDAKEDKKIGQPGDWLNIPEYRLAARLDPTSTLSDEKGRAEHRLMRVMKTTDGRIVGRAAINCEPRWSFKSRGGWVTVAGLRATRMSNIAGVVLGDALTAARDAARPLIDAQGLASWASEQALLIAKFVKDEERQARGAEVVLSCGGNVGNLKILRWGQTWLDQNELRARLNKEKRVDITFEGEFSYDEDTDDVLPREFRDEFKQADDVAVVPRHDGSVIRANTLIWPQSLPGGAPRSDSQLAVFVRRVLQEVWGERPDTTSVTRVVGKVDGTEIQREVTSFWEDDLSEN